MTNTKRKVEPLGISKAYELEDSNCCVCKTEDAIEEMLRIEAEALKEGHTQRYLQAKFNRLVSINMMEVIEDEAKRLYERGDEPCQYVMPASLSAVASAVGSFLINYFAMISGGRVNVGVDGGKCIEERLRARSAINCIDDFSHSLMAVLELSEAYTVTRDETGITFEYNAEYEDVDRFLDENGFDEAGGGETVH